MQASPVTRGTQHYHVRASPVGPVGVYVVNSSDGEVAYAAGLALVSSAPEHLLFTFVFHII
jgi:hypothetical protein